MYAIPEQLAASSKAGMDLIVGLASTQFAAMARLSELNFNATKTAFEDNVNYAKALLGAKDAQEIVSLNTAAAQPALEKALAYSRGVYEIATQAQGEMTKFAETQAAAFNKNVVTTLDQYSDNAPAGSDVAVAAVKSAIAAANSAYESFARVTKQASEIADSNFAAATSVVKEAKRKAA